MKKSSKKTLEQRGVIVAGRAMNAPSSRSHEDKRHLKRSTAKQNLKREYQRETARNRGPFDFQARLTQFKQPRAIVQSGSCSDSVWFVKKNRFATHS